MRSSSICRAWTANRPESWRPFGTPSIPRELLFPASSLSTSSTEAWILTSSLSAIWEICMGASPPSCGSCSRSVCSTSNTILVSLAMLARCPSQLVRHHPFVHLKGIIRSFGSVCRMMHRLFNLASCVIDNDVRTAMASGKAVLPLDSSVFVFSGFFALL